jgi:DNA (cytosine-5)-methyltransferase 1
MVNSRPSESLSAVDLFCGSGAVTTALQKKGFRVLLAVDNDPVACRTYRMNHSGVKLIEADIRSIESASLIEQHPNIIGADLLAVCAPCQPFSSQNRKRGFDDRADLVIEAARFAQSLRPKCILIENVPGLATPGNSHIIQALKTRLRRAGYHLSAPRRIDAADVGVPQRRLRCVMIASPCKQALRIFEEYRFRRRRRSVREVIEKLPQLESGDFWRRDPLHRARTHQPIALKRLRAIPKDGGSRSQLPQQLWLECHHDDSHSFSDVYGRMRWDDVAPTLTTGCDDVTKGRFAHPEQDRAITLREAALLQTFPKHYKFAGNRRDIARQIGNAVPVTMIEGLVPILKRAVILAAEISGSLS